MKTRIISGVVAFALFVGVVLLYSVFPPVMTIVLCALSALAVYELLWATGIMKNPVVVVSAVLAAVCIVLRMDGILPVRTAAIMGVYAALLLAVTLWKNKDITPGSAAISLVAPLILGFAFWSVSGLLRMGYIYFWLIFVYAWGSDTGAYFVGSLCGRHKLAPVLSPKKTVEGLIGGVVTSLVLTAALTLIMTDLSFAEINWLKLIPLSVLFSLAGTVGDITASYIKRQQGIKDYGNLMPGHGGVLDRFDSVVMIAPLMFIFF